MKTIKKILIGLAAVLLFLVCTDTFYTVNLKEYAAIRQFGKIVRVETTPGLRFKMPFIQNVQYISASTRLYDVPESDVITRDKKSMIADDYVLWRVTDPVRYVQTVNAVDARIQERIEAAVYNATKSVISSMSQDEVIESRGETLTALLTEDANESMESYGIEILQVQIKALDLPDDNKEAVYERMISERQNIAASYKAEGDATAQKIRNETDRKVAVMEAEAEKKASVLEAEGESRYMEILQSAYDTQEKADFYNYIRGLDSLKHSLRGNKTLILDKDSELVRILYGRK